MKYKWRKGLANAALIFLGVVIFKIGSTEILWTWAYWHPIVGSAASATFLAELRYIFAWLNSVNGNGHDVPLAK